MCRKKVLPQGRAVSQFQQAPNMGSCTSPQPGQVQATPPHPGQARAVMLDERFGFSQPRGVFQMQCRGDLDEGNLTQGAAQLGVADGDRQPLGVKEMIEGVGLHPIEKSFENDAPGFVVFHQAQPGLRNRRAARKETARIPASV